LVCIVLFSIWQILGGWRLPKGEVKAQAADQNLIISLPKVPGIEELDMPAKKLFSSIGVVFPDPNRNKIPDNTPLIDRPSICYGCHNPKSIYAQSIATLDSDKHYHHPMGLFARKENSPRALGTYTAEGLYPGRGAWDLNGQLNCLSCHTYHECNEYCEKNDNNNFLRWNFKNDSPEFCITCHHDKNDALLGELGKGHSQQKETAFTNRVVFNNGWKTITSKNCMFCHYIHDGKRVGERYDYSWSSYGYDMENLAAYHKPGDYIPSELDALMRVPAKVLPEVWADNITIRAADTLPTHYEDMCYGCHGREGIVAGEGSEGSLLMPGKYFSHRYDIDPNDGRCPDSKMKPGGVFPVSDGDSTDTVDDYGVPNNRMYCGSCHNVHDAGIKPYLNGDHSPYITYPHETDGFCQGCHHSDAADLGQEYKNFMGHTHPIYKEPLPPATFDPLYTDQKLRNGGDGKKGATFAGDTNGGSNNGSEPILCLSCHNVHAAMTNFDGSKAKKFDDPSSTEEKWEHGKLLVIDNNQNNNAQKSDLCMQCHSHDPASPHRLYNEKGQCAVCHVPHLAESKNKIWARPLIEGYEGVRKLCNSCHYAGNPLAVCTGVVSYQNLAGKGNVFCREEGGADHVMHGGAYITAGNYPQADSLRDTSTGLYKDLGPFFPLDPNDTDTIPEMTDGDAHDRQSMNYTSGGAGFYCGTCHNVHKNGGGACLRYIDNDSKNDRPANDSVSDLTFGIRKTFCSQCHGVPHAEDNDCMECHAPHRGAINIEDDEDVGRLILTVSPLSDTTLYVDDDYPDAEDTDGDNEFRHIQAAVNASWRRVAIVIYPGMYAENIDFKSKAITLMSLDPNDPAVVAATLIDGNQAGSVVTFTNYEGSEAVLSGVTLQNGQADKGGGIYCSSSSPTITNCIIKENSATSSGGGIYCYNESSPTISNCTIGGNSAPNGGGIYCLFDSAPTITNCTIRENSASNGGGIRCTSSSPTIKNCSIEDNSAKSYGGGVYCYASSAILINCTITENSASSGGGGFRCYNSSPVITNCTISGNSAPTGGGIYNYSYSPETNFPTIKNCILWSNLLNEISGDSLIVTYSDIKGGYEGTGNIHDEPLFVDAECYLSPNSPCIDAGTGQGAPENDKVGHPRPINALYDMGAYECSACPFDSLEMFYQDDDVDSYGNPNIISFGCERPQGFVENADDCDDCDPNTNPDASEICDFVDNNCNGSIDEGLALSIFYADTDEDGYGNPDISIEACKEPSGYKPNHLDCNDDDLKVNPAKITIKTTDNGPLDNFTNGRNLLKTLQPSCYPYTSFDLLSDFQEKGDTLTFQYRKPQSSRFKPTYWFFGRVSGEEVDLSNNPSEEEDNNLYVIDKKK